MHPEAVLSQLSDEARTAYEAKSAERTRLRDVELTHSMMELKPFFEARTHRRFDAADGTPCQLREESAMLLDADSRLDAAGRFATGAAKQ
jgi:glutaredoxin-related protein